MNNETRRAMRGDKGRVGKPPSGTVTRAGQHFSGNRAASVDNAVATQPKNTGYQKIKGAVSG